MITERQQYCLKQLETRIKSAKLQDYHVEIRNSKYCLFYKDSLLVVQHKDHEKLWATFEKYLGSMRDK